MVKKLELELKKKIGNNFNSVRKAWLEIDEKHVGYITAEEIAKFLGASGQKKFDYTLLEILIKMKSTKLNTRIYYKDFCAWLGSCIEPTEAFYFRHDSQKNPQYDLNVKKATEANAPNQLLVSKIITSGLKAIKERFLARTFNQFKSVQKAFIEWRNPGKNHIEFEHFKEMMEAWGFKSDCRELFDWLDLDKDGVVSFNDLRATAGVEIAPMEQFFFRQDIKSSKNVPCNFTGCWENLLYQNEKSPYCPLHQKVIKNSVIDLFQKIAAKFTSQEWDLFTYDLIKTEYKIKISDLLQKLEDYKQIKLQEQQIKNIWDSFKVNSNDDDLLDQRKVNVKDLVSRKLNRKGKRIDELIQLQQNEDQHVRDQKLHGLVQLDG